MGAVRAATPRDFYSAETTRVRAQPGRIALAADLRDGFFASHRGHVRKGSHGCYPPFGPDRQQARGVEGAGSIRQSTRAWALTPPRSTGVSCGLPRKRRRPLKRSLCSCRRAPVSSLRRLSLAGLLGKPRWWTSGWLSAWRSDAKIRALSNAKHTRLGQ